MIEILTRNALRILVGLCAMLALVGLFFRAEYGIEALPFMYPLVALIAVPAVVLWVRVLSRLLETEPDTDSPDSTDTAPGEDHAD
ncbi:MAG: hypothetical protein ACNA7J_05050 [Wenzhouxiangella sp.]